jgi:hypothetical protein
MMLASSMKKEIIKGKQENRKEQEKESKHTQIYWTIAMRAKWGLKSSPLRIKKPVKEL